MGTDVCRIVDVSTSVNLTYTMPRAISLPRAEGLRRSYQGYYKALLLHEQGHGDIAIQAARAIEVQLRKIRKHRNCDGISRSADVKAREILRIYRAANRAYDRQTDHGFTQGVSIFQH